MNQPPITLPEPTVPGRPSPAGWIRFDRNELAGSFGDIGTDLPLLIAMIAAAGLDSASVFIVFGLAQIATGLAYGLPMPMQPLKAMAVLVITHELGGPMIFGAGLAIGLAMLVLAATGALDWLARVIPHSVVRGVQMGLGLALASLALRNYIPAQGAAGYGMAAAAFVIVVALWGNRRFPAALFVIGLGAAYALVFQVQPAAIAGGVGLALPAIHTPVMADILMGAVVLALPQLPLSLSNSVIATNQTLRDLYPERRVGIRKLGLTYGIANLIVPFFSGVPVCHGCGGLAGHYAFGARTGGSVVIYGTMFLLLGLLFSGVADEVVQVFPQPVLGVVLLFEALVLMLFIRDVAESRRDLTIALLVAVLAFTLPHGFVIGLAIGTAVYYLSSRYGLMIEKHP